MLGKYKYSIANLKSQTLSHTPLFDNTGYQNLETTRWQLGGRIALLILHPALEEGGKDQQEGHTQSVFTLLQCWQAETNYLNTKLKLNLALEQIIIVSSNLSLLRSQAESRL